MMKLSKKEVVNFGKIQSLSKMAFIAINKNLCIEHINIYAKKLLGIINDNNLIGKSIIEVLEQLHFPPIISDKGKIIAAGFILINGYFQKWKKSIANVENEKWILLIGQNLGREKTIYQSFLTAFENSKIFLNKDKLYLNSIIENLPELVFWKDNNYIYQGCNKRVAELLNLNNPSEIIGRSDHDFGWSEERIKSLQEVDSSIIQKGITSIVEDAIPVKGILKTHLTSKTPLRDKMGLIIGILGISTDISERKKMEEDLKLAKEAAEAANQSKAAFIANMSHDLRTPLAGIIGLSTMIENETHNLDEKQNAHLIHDSGKQLLILLNGILDVVAADNLGENDIHNESFDLHQLIEDIVQLERPTTQSKQLALLIKIDKNVPSYVTSDRTKLHRILLNLLGNAIKFTKTGSITIEVKCLDTTETDVHLQFGVTDTGIGIPMKLQDKVFDRFYRVTPSYKGTYEGHGVGLDIAQSYVTLLGGRITLTSQEGVGTTFFFDLPCKIDYIKDTVLQENAILVQEKMVFQSTKAPAPIPVIDTIPKELQTTNTRAPCILLVEDSPIALKIIESLVKEAGCRFKSSIDGEHALELATTYRFDLILTDIGLPGISGHKFAQRFRAWEKSHHKKRIPIIGLTAHGRDTAIKKCLLYGMDDVFSKPANLNMIQNVLKKHHIQEKSIETQSTQLHNKSDLPVPEKLGPDLPNTEDKLFSLDSFLIFDPSHLLKQASGDETLTLELLNTYITHQVQQDVYEMMQAYKKKDWNAIEKLAHKLKGGASYLGTHRMFYACQYLERYYKAGYRNSDVLDKLFHQIININQKTITTVECWLNQHRKK